MTSEPQPASMSASGRASERRQSYLNACTMDLSDPSYAPIARARTTWLPARRQRLLRPLSTLMTLQESSGSPQVSQTGGRIGVMAHQQSSQTTPRVGWSRLRAQAAQGGARRIAIAESATVRATAEIRRLNPATAERVPGSRRRGGPLTRGSADGSACSTDGALPPARHPSLRSRDQADDEAGSSSETSIRSASPQSRSSE
jgi:hypothetical protein